MKLQGTHLGLLVFLVQPSGLLQNNVLHDLDRLASEQDNSCRASIRHGVDKLPQEVRLWPATDAHRDSNTTYRSSTPVNLGTVAGYASGTTPATLAVKQVRHYLQVRSRTMCLVISCMAHVSRLLAEDSGLT
jgi:hypothetical protein